MTSRFRPGFALPAVLTVTGVVTLIFLVAITALSSLNSEARSARERVRFMQQALTAEASLQYMVATEPFGARSVEVGAARGVAFGDDMGAAPAPSGVDVTSVFLDGRPYEVPSEGPDPHSVLLSLRDQAGLLNLAWLSDEQLERLGARMGLPATLARTLRPLYADYVDPDDLETINGAESARYGGAGPANRPMLRPSELLSLLGVREATRAVDWRAVRDDVTVDHLRTATNVNTAGSTVLQTLFNITPQQAEDGIRAREAAPFLTLNDFMAATGAIIVDDGMQLFTFPSGRIVYTITDTRSAWRYRARLVPTPVGLERPFWVDQTEMTEAPRTAMSSEDATRFPYTAD